MLSCTIRENPPGSGYVRCGTAASGEFAVLDFANDLPYQTAPLERVAEIDGAVASQGGQRGDKPILRAFKAAECGGGGGENAQRVQKPFGSSRAEGLPTVEPVQMTGGRSQQANEEVAMADRGDGLPDDFPGQPRPHRPDVDRLIDESGGRNADALDSLDSSRMLHGGFPSVSGCSNGTIDRERIGLPMAGAHETGAATP